ncbi:hypothetical protein [Biostraticola tofi]|uniref:Putative HAD superfamily hydrolase n=1 Tax=Biostraticola tofi TaxID=466109 RepID=A0A4R3YYI2_9GAMM|nr:hypothetical protein [Biostraticola tofi]TCV98285.1 putative HAD superfamily hydrolase [Biostraticola tofi]
MYKLKTVDVWDTLLRRKCHPDFIKLATARYFYYKYFKLHKITDQRELFSSRVSIEQQLGAQHVLAGFDDEYLFENVLFQWVEKYLPGHAHETVQQISHELCEFEFSLEMSLTDADENIKDVLAAYPAKATIFLSDFYMGKERLAKLLEKNGFSSILQGGYSSADIKLNKRSGKLFEYIHEQLGVAYEDWIHFGDNEWSDCIKPAELGIKSVRFLPEYGHNKRLETEHVFSDSNKLFAKILSGADQSLKSVGSDDKIFSLGVRSSPFIVGYSLFILEKAIESDSRKIYFFTREGEFFCEAFSAIIDSLKSEMPDIEFPEYQILEVSRIATFCASLQDVSTDEMMRLWNLYSSQSLNALFKTLDVEQHKYSVFANKHHIPLEEVIRYPWQDSRIISLFADEDFKKSLLEDIEIKRSLLLGYFMSKGLTNQQENICVVDVGWRGTIQDNIALILPKVNFTGVYLGLAKYLNPQPGNSKKYAYGPDLNLSDELPFFLDSVAPIEMITNSPAGSVVGYEIVNGSYCAIRKIDEAENKAWYDFTAKLQKGVLASLNSWADYLISHSLTSHDLRPLSMKIWGDFIQGSSQELNSTFDSLNHNETFGLGDYVAKSHTPTVSDILSSTYNWRKRAQLIDFIVANQWSEGIRKRKELSFVRKHLLAFVIDLAIFYKRRFHRRR